MLNILSVITMALNFAPGIKTKLAAVAAFLLAIVQGWNALAPTVGLAGAEIHIPDFINAAVLALLGVGAANQPVNQHAKLLDKR